MERFCFCFRCSPLVLCWRRRSFNEELTPTIDCCAYRRASVDQVESPPGEMRRKVLEWFVFLRCSNHLQPFRHDHDEDGEQEGNHDLCAHQGVPDLHGILRLSKHLQRPKKIKPVSRKYRLARCRNTIRKEALEDRFQDQDSRRSMRYHQG